MAVLKCYTSYCPIFIIYASVTFMWLPACKQFTDNNEKYYIQDSFYSLWDMVSDLIYE